MSWWVKHSEDKNMPDWIKLHLRDTCPYCGKPMYNYYNNDGKCTNRRCEDNFCPGMVAARADYGRKLLKLPQLGFATCLSIVQAKGYKMPIMVIYEAFGKVEVTVAQYLKLLCFEGIDGEWDNICEVNNIYTIDDIFNKYDGYYAQMLKDNEYTIRYYAQFVTFAQPKLPVREDIDPEILTIMITGTPIGYLSKEHFIEDMNAKCGGYIKILHQKTKRQSGVDFLIREEGSTTRGKVEAAIKGGIPIVTSNEFKAILADWLCQLRAGLKN